MQNEDTLNYMFSMIDAHKEACDLFGSNSPTFKDYRVEKLGKVIKTEHGWKITEKLRLNWGE